MPDSTYLAAAGFIINLLLGGVLWFMKQTYSDLKEKQKELSQEVEKLKEHAVRKDDFAEFKFELWKRLDKFEQHLDNIRK